MAHHYKEVRLLGRGNFGAAFLVEKLDDPGRGEMRVMKKIHLQELSEEEVKGAKKEAECHAQLDHPRIVKYYESYSDEKMDLCIIMEYCAGGDLAKVLREADKPIPEPQVLTWFIQTCEALYYCHYRRGLLHRDIKVQNIFLTADGNVKLGDFGIAKVLEATTEMALTVVGSPYSISPEICQNLPYNYKSDIWSLGCVLFELCTLRHVFEGANLLAIAWQIVQSSVPPIPETYSPDLRQLVNQMLSKAPEDRPSIRNILEMPFIRNFAQQFMYPGQPLPFGKQRPPPVQPPQHAEPLPSSSQFLHGDHPTPLDLQSPTNQNLAAPDADRAHSRTGSALSDTTVRYGLGLDAVSGGTLTPTQLLLKKKQAQADERRAELAQASATTVSAAQIARQRKHDELYGTLSANNSNNSSNATQFNTVIKTGALAVPPPSLGQASSSMPNLQYAQNASVPSSSSSSSSSPAPYSVSSPSVPVPIPAQCPSPVSLHSAQSEKQTPEERPIRRATSPPLNASAPCALSVSVPHGASPEPTHAGRRYTDTDASVHTKGRPLTAPATACNIDSEEEEQYADDFESLSDSELEEGGEEEEAKTHTPRPSTGAITPSPSSSSRPPSIQRFPSSHPDGTTASPSPRPTSAVETSSASSTPRQQLTNPDDRPIKGQSSTATSSPAGKHVTSSSLSSASHMKRPETSASTPTKREPWPGASAAGAGSGGSGAERAASPAASRKSTKLRNRPAGRLASSRQPSKSSGSAGSAGAKRASKVGKEEKEKKEQKRAGTSANSSHSHRSLGRVAEKEKDKKIPLARLTSVNPSSKNDRVSALRGAILKQLGGNQPSFDSMHSFYQERIPQVRMGQAKPLQMDELKKKFGDQLSACFMMEQLVFLETPA